MIRILVLVLLAANLLYLGWSRWIRDEAPPLVAPAAGPARAQDLAQSPAPAVPASTCTSIGPIRDDTRALEIEQLLGELPVSLARRNVTEEVREGWWVYVANPNAAAQQRSLRAIQGAGIGDAFSMPDDPDFRVSVGLFSEQERATSRAEAVRALRLDAVVNERMQTQQSVWFDLVGTAPAALDLARFSAEGIEVRDLRIEACPAAGAVDSAPPAAAAAADAGTAGV
jgi:hypothetical protein